MSIERSAAYTFSTTVEAHFPGEVPAPIPYAVKTKARTRAGRIRAAEKVARDLEDFYDKNGEGLQRPRPTMYRILIRNIAGDIVWSCAA